MVELLSFDPDRLCPKCVDSGASYWYCRGAETVVAVDPEGGEKIFTLNPPYPLEACHLVNHEHHHRRCRRCSYIWLEHVMPPRRLRAADTT